MANGVTHWGVEGAKNGSNNGATPENKNKIVYYYAAGAFTLLLVVKLLSSDFFRQAIDYSITYLPFVLLVGVIISNVRKYRAHPERGEEIRKNALHKLFYLLLITLLFYILYSPGSFVPIGEAISKFSRLASLENYFLILSYVCVIVISLAPMAFFVRVYQKSTGYYKGSLRDSARHLLYSTFFIFFLIFVSSILTYPSAYAPVTGYVSDTVYALFLKPDNANATDSVAQARISNIKSALGKTYNNLTESFTDSSEKLSTTIADTKATLDTAIERTNKSLKDSLSEDIEDKLDVVGGTLAGDLTVEDDLVVEGQSTMANIIPDADDTYNLGSVTKGWEHIYTGFLHGSSLLTVGDGSSSHSLTATDDFLVSGDFEVNGDSYLDGAATIGGNLTVGSLSGILKASTGAVSVATGGTDYENPLTFSNSLSRSTNTITLVNDSVAPGVSKYYGTDAGGVKGFFDFSAGVTVHSALTNLDYATAGHTGFEPTITAGSAGDYYRYDKTWATLNTSAVSGLGTIATQNSNSVSITGGSASGITQLTVDNIDLNGNTINITSGDLTITAEGGDISFGNEDLATTGTLSAGAATFSTVNTGPGATEVYLMDQNLRTSDGVIFPSLTGGAATTSDLILKTTSGVAASGADMLFQTGNNGGTEAMKIDNNGITYINSLQSGAQTFENDAGVVQWVDLPVTSAAASTVESYAAMLDGNAVMTVYGTADGSSGITANSQSVGIMTATPAATLHVVNNEGAGATNQGLLLHLDNTAFAGSSSTASNNGGGLVVTADAASGTGFDFFAAISSAGEADDTEFRVNGQGDVYGDGAAYVSGADYAEFFYTKNTDLQPGELVCVDVTGKKAVKRCTRANDLDLIGIISTKPAFVGNNIPGAEANLGETDQNYKLVGLIGQVPAKVTNENGEIKAGDSLTSASKPGYAMKASAGDSTVGVALESSDKKDATITVLISRRNKSLTVEQVEEETTRRIAEMNIEDEVSVLISDKINIYDQSISANSTDIDSLENEISTLKTDLQAQITELQNKTNTELNLAQIDLNKADIALIKQTLGMDTAEAGDISIIGQISAKKIVVEEAETGGITIVTADEATDSIGKATIVTGETSVVIETEAVKSDSKVFVTAKNVTDKTLAVTDIADGSFTVAIEEAGLEDLEFDWLVVGVK